MAGFLLSLIKVGAALPVFIRTYDALLYDPDRVTETICN